jgi:hypothetical protein
MRQRGHDSLRSKPGTEPGIVRPDHARSPAGALSRSTDQAADYRAGRLLGTRCAWMARYAPLLTPEEFTKFVILMRDLAPYLFY